MNLYRYVLNNPTNSSDPTGLASICNSFFDCVWVDGDGDGKVAENDVPAAQVEQIKRDFGGAISRLSGQNLTGYGKKIVGSDSNSNKTMVRVVSQFVGASFARKGGDNYEQWRRIPEIRVERAGILTSIERLAPWDRPPSFMANTGAMVYSGYYYGNFVNLFNSPSNVARLMIHETMHRGYWHWTNWYGLHNVMDSQARDFLGESGLGGGGCWAGYGMDGCD